MILAGTVLEFPPRPAHAVRRWPRLLKPAARWFLLGLAAGPWLEPVMAAVDADVPAGTPGFEAFLRRPPFGRIEPVEQMLTEAGDQAVQTVTDQVDTVYDSPGQWWAAVSRRPRGRSPGGHIPPARLDAARKRRLHHPGRPPRTRRHADPDPHLRVYHRPETRPFSPHAAGGAVTGGWQSAALQHGNLTEPLMPFDAIKPNVARAYDDLLGGKDNFGWTGTWPKAGGDLSGIRQMVRENRRVLLRALDDTLAQGIRQYVDSARPADVPAVHEIVRDRDNTAAVVYVDNDPVGAQPPVGTGRKRRRPRRRRRRGSG